MAMLSSLSSNMSAAARRTPRPELESRPAAWTMASGEDGYRLDRKARP